MEDTKKVTLKQERRKTKITKHDKNRRQKKATKKAQEKNWILLF